MTKPRLILPLSGLDQSAVVGGLLDAVGVSRVAALGLIGTCLAVRVDTRGDAIVNKVSK